MTKQEYPITGVVEIRFKKEASEDDVQEVITNLYLNNKAKIEGMTFSQFANEGVLKKAHKLIESLN